MRAADGRDCLQLADALAGLHAQARLGVLREMEAAGGFGGVEADLDRRGHLGQGHFRALVDGFPLEVPVDDHDVPEVHVRDVAQLAHVEAGDNGGDAHLVADFGIVVPDEAFLEAVGAAGVRRWSPVPSS